MIRKENQNYSVWAMNNNKYLINFVPGGIYRMNTFVDLDGNKKFSGGHLFPFLYSEPFIVKDDTIKVRKRWETSDVDFFFPKN